MENKEIPSAKKFWNKSPKDSEIEIMIDFAKLHVEAALASAAEKSYVEYIDLTNNEVFDYTDVITDDDVRANVNKDSILNSYPESNIK